MSTITGKKGLSFLIFTVFLGSYVLTACRGETSEHPTTESTATATYTPSPTSTRTPRPPTPTPVYHYKEINGMNVPTNVYLEGDSCIPFELQGVEKCVNMFVYGETPTVPSTWKGIVHVIGDVIINSLTIEPGTEVYVAAHSDIHNLVTGNEYDMMSGINNTSNPIRGVAPGEPFRDEGNHITIRIDTDAPLYVLGTKEKPVLITSSAEEPTRYDWNTFSFITGGRIDYTTIEYVNGVAPGSNSTISNSIIRHIVALVVMPWDNNLTTNVKIINNHIYDAAHELIDIWNSDVSIVGNELGPNMTSDLGFAGGRGIILTLPKGGQVEMYYNIFHDNDFAGILISSSPKIPFILDGNTFYGNRQDIFCPNTNYCSENKTYFLENNQIEIPNFNYFKDNP